MKNYGLCWVWKEMAQGGFAIEIDDGSLYGGTVKTCVSTLEEAERIVKYHNKEILNKVEVK